MKLTIEEVRHVAALARIGMTDAELELMRDQLSHILESFDALGQVDTDGVEPTRHSVDVDSVMRDDEVRDSLLREDVLANAPSKEGDFVRVRAVLGDH
ncbi:MAG: Asp-tRNA(Asn)/Glu-tRNA(Gln) amidotransferase subunit GatC [Chloroflexi bacterium]|nr:Asp-tRNA(Asn)/Glu-tRNA(Gln) amidotransferase subunit GatC [Chloroflexota bacterium]